MTRKSAIRARQERLLALLEEFGQSATDYDEGEEEDIRPYFWHESHEDFEELSEWCCITQNGTPGSFEYKTFFLPTFDTVEGAMARAEEFANDDIFVELPVAVVNLDTGERLDAQLAARWLPISTRIA